jgi:ligand-binding sensor domain-containing protein
MLMAGCAVENKENDTPPVLYPQPKTVDLKIGEGYAVNTVTGDTIQPLINSLGDTVVTGIPILAIGKIIHVDSMEAPKRYPIPTSDQLTIKDAHANVHRVPENLYVIPVNKDSIKRIPIKETTEVNKKHFIKNSIGDTVFTGVPMVNKGRTVVSSQPNTTIALTPRFRDNASVNMQYLDLDQGMISSFVNGMLEDNKGNLWFATDGGASRYDGSSFVHYTDEEGLTKNLVETIFEAKSGDIWFGTRGRGMCKYDGTSFTHFTAKEGLTNVDINWVLEDKSGNLWFATNGAGAIKYDGTSFTYYTKNEGLLHNSVWSILEDRSGNIWFATHAGLCKYDGSSFVQFTQNAVFSTNPVWTILEDKNGDIWCAIDEVVYRYNGTSFTRYTEKEGLAGKFILAILEDKSGDIWFASDAGVCKYDGISFTHYTKKQGLSNDNVYSILEDKRGNLWFGTGGGGVNKYNKGGFTHFTKNEGLIDNLVWSILEDKNRDMWFSTEGGICKYDGTHYTHYTTNEGLSYDQVMTALEDKNGNIWFACNDGSVNRYDGKFFTQYTDKQGLTDKVTRAMLEDKSGNIWFGTWRGGVSKYDGTTFTHYTDKNGLSYNVISSMLEDHRGNIWLATQGGGVSKFDGSHFTHYTEKEGLSDNVALSIMEDKDKNLWFGTNSGLSKFDGKSFTHYTTKDGLSNKYIYSIKEDQNSNIWISTAMGLSLIPHKSVTGSDAMNDTLTKAPDESLYRIEKNDGLMGMGFASNSVLFDSKNRIWWGSEKSLTMLDLNNFALNNKAPTVHLRQLNINGNNIDFRKVKDSLTSTISYTGVQDFENYPVNLELAHHQNHLTFHFSGIDWAAPHKIKYSYLMDGHTGNWSTPTAETKADYRNLSYGRYTFKVMAIGESGTWSHPFEYSFIVHPPWWHTWWARAGYLISLLLVVVALVRWRTANLTKRQNELEKEVDLATREIREQKEEVEKEKERSEDLLLNILPEEVAEELKTLGEYKARNYQAVTVLFTDFEGFTMAASKMTAEELVYKIGDLFKAFDKICENYDIEKIKTIGDAYMAASGLNHDEQDEKAYTANVVKATLDMQTVIADAMAKNDSSFQMRAGIHTGPVVAGIVGVKKFQYDIWGDTVNTASRMESNGQVGKVNVSQTTYDLLKDDPQFSFESRGKIDVKGKGEIEMYFASIV